LSECEAIADKESELGSEDCKDVTSDYLPLALNQKKTDPKTGWKKYTLGSANGSANGSAKF
jgi:hypothetical protein